MKMNTTKVVQKVYTPEGGRAKVISPLLELRRSVLATLLWEDGFYENGQSIAERIQSLVAKVDPTQVAYLAIEARTKGKLRHVPLLLVREMARLNTHKHLVADTLYQVIQRPDELAEFISIYNKDKKQPLSNQVKRGLAAAFTKFDEYSLSKYSSEGKNYSLKDVMFLTHPTPKDSAQAALWKRLINNELKTPETWEVRISETKGVGKKAVWEELLAENKLGALALLRNLRNFKENGVNEKLITNALDSMKVDRVLPFRFIGAARFYPSLEDQIQDAMFKCINGIEKIPGDTIILVDVSKSMDKQLSEKSDITRLEAGVGLSILTRELCENVKVFTFSRKLVEVPNRRGFALRDAIVNSQEHRDTFMGAAIKELNDKYNYDRLIVLSDEATADVVPNPKCDNAYMINIASNQYGVGYGANWKNFTGFSENILSYIFEFEQLGE